MAALNARLSPLAATDSLVSLESLAAEHNAPESQPA